MTELHECDYLIWFDLIFPKPQGMFLPLKLNSTSVIPFYQGEITGQSLYNAMFGTHTTGPSYKWT